MVSNGSSTGDQRLLRLSPRDNVAVATVHLTVGMRVRCDGLDVAIASDIKLGHKVAIVPITSGGKIYKYGAPIGSATCAIAAGEHVHMHNLKSDYLPTFTLDGHNPFIAESA